jgi:hypothetical protein
MRRHLGIVLTPLAVLLALAILASTAVSETEEVTHEYIGVKKCKMCHKKDGTFPSWEKTPHATAWDRLSDEDKKDESLKKYYTTGTNAKGELLTGVQCEVCHGPGSDYKKKAVMKDHDKSVAAGLNMPDEKTCLGCHNEKAPPALAKVAKDFDYKKLQATGVHDLPEDSSAAKK